MKVLETAIIFLFLIAPFYVRAWGDNPPNSTERVDPNIANWIVLVTLIFVIYVILRVRKLLK
jgi:hypothetical protein